MGRAMTNNEIIKETTQAVKGNLNAGCYIDELLRIIERQRAEAVKEFATRLEEYSYESMGNYGISRMVVSIKDIDNLVKEMEKKYEIS